MLIYSNNVEDHLTHKEDFIKRIELAKLTTDPKKTHLFKDKIEFLGYTLSRQGIDTVTHNIAKIKNFDAFKSKRDCKLFLGITNYYRKHSKNIARISKPIVTYSLYGISGDALDWFKSYLSNRVQRVIIGDTVSECKNLNFGVPQGSVLGPKIYCMYTKPISDIIAGHGLSHHCYADDTQLYIAIEHSANLHSELLRMERCVADIRNWMRHNMLKLNDDKTELIVFASRYNQHLYSDASMMIGNTTVVCEPQVKNLGVIFDQVMSMRQHVNYTSRTVRFHLRNISRIRRYIPEESCKLVVQSLVTSRLDYSNGLLYGIPKSAVSILQSVQNSAARIVTKTAPREHITPVLRELHWLPVERRIEYKILLYAYKALNGLAPEYLCNMVELYAPDRVLRSASQNLLVVHRGKHCQYGMRTFAMAAATLWNSLNVRDRSNRIRGSPSLESFKSNLKTLLFKEHFYPFSS